MDPTTKVFLNQEEFTFSAISGVFRRTTAIHAGWKREPGRFDAGFDYDCTGSIGEYVVAKYFRRFWTPNTRSTDTATGDVGNLQVKTVINDRLSLIVRTHDPEHFAYVSVYLQMFEAPIYGVLRGWMSGREAKLPKYWQPVDREKRIHQACYMVPASQLHPIQSLALS